MLRTVLCTLCALCLCFIANAQKGMPQFIMKDTASVSSKASMGWSNAASTRRQFIYHPASFPGVPSGTVKNIYFRWAADSVARGPWLDMRIGLKATSMAAYPHKGAYDTFVKFESWVVDKASFPITDTIHRGTWVKIPLTEGSFFYDNTQNFALDLSFARLPVPANGTIHFGTSPYMTYYSFLGGDRDSIRSTTTQSDFFLLSIGFDLATTGVEGEAGINAFGLFPNPATGGRFNVSFDARQAIREASVTVTDAAGRQVYSKTYLGVGASFFREVNLSGAAPGIYFVKVAADGAVISRRVVVE